MPVFLFFVTEATILVLETFSHSPFMLTIHLNTGILQSSQGVQRTNRSGKGKPRTLECFICSDSETQRYRGLQRDCFMPFRNLIIIFCAQQKKKEYCSEKYVSSDGGHPSFSRWAVFTCKVKSIPGTQSLCPCIALHAQCRSCDTRGQYPFRVKSQGKRELKRHVPARSQHRNRWSCSLATPLPLRACSWHQQPLNHTGLIQKYLSIWCNFY